MTKIWKPTDWFVDLDDGVEINGTTSCLIYSEGADFAGFPCDYTSTTWSYYYAGHN